MYLRLRKRRKPTDAPSNPEESSTTPATGAEPAEPSSGDWVEADSAPGELAEGTELDTAKHPNRGNARESARGSHR